MYREMVKREGNTVLFIIALVVGVLVCLGILANIPIPHYAFLVHVLAVFVLLVVAFLLFKYKISETRYVMIDSDLIIQRVLGHNESVLASINLDQILIIAPMGSKSLKPYSKVNKIYRLCGSFLAKCKYCGVFTQNGVQCKFIFEPSPKLLSLLKRNLPEKVHI